jgi:NAD+--asparagine ADP-ribosyltransferase
MEDVSSDIKTEINPETQLTTTAVRNKSPYPHFSLNPKVSTTEIMRKLKKKTSGKTRPNAMRRRMLTREGEC